MTDLQVVLGIDTHKYVHVVVALDASATCTWGRVRIELIKGDPSC